MPEYTPVEMDPVNTPPPYMDPGNATAHKLQKQRSMTAGEQTPARCKHCGSVPNPHGEPVFIWPAPRPQEHIRMENGKFVGYVLVIALVIFLLFAACKYLP